MNDDSLQAKDYVTEIGILEDRIASKEKKKHQKAREATWVRSVLEAEAVNKYWSGTAKAKTPKQMIRKLRNPVAEPPEYTTHSTKMTALARDYHESLQHKDLAPWGRTPRGHRESPERNPRQCETDHERQRQTRRMSKRERHQKGTKG